MNMNDIKQKEALASLAKNDKEALAQLLVEWINPNHIALDYISLLMNTRSLNPGN